MLARIPKNLRTILKSPTMLSPVQADEFNDLVEANGGYPQGVPDAREDFRVVPLLVPSL